MNDSKKFPEFEKKSSKITRDLILKIIDNGGQENAEILEKMGLDQKSASSLGYYLSTMVEEKTIEKKDGKWHKIPKPPSEFAEEIITTLLEDNCSLKNIDIIKEKIKEDISDDTLSWTLQTLRNNNQIYEHKKEFGIKSSELNKHNRCYLCMREFNDKQLIISILFQDGTGTAQNFQIHALCRDSIDRNNDLVWNISAGDCDYCGLSLSAKHLLHNKSENINLDKEIDMLFNEPFSKIFSSIDSSNHGDKTIDVTSFACPKTENGKQYHPYCFDIIQESKKEPKK